MKSLISFLFCLIALSASAYDFEVDGIYYNILSSSDKTCEVTYKTNPYGLYSRDDYKGIITIPTSVTYNDITFSVISIGDEAFKINNLLTSVTLSSSITQIGWSAFAGCSNLTEINLPNTVEKIGTSAFDSCSALAVISIPDNLKYIPARCFALCPLTSISIPSNVSYIEDGAFYGCKQLESVNFEGSLRKIYSEAFSDCSSIKELVFPEGLSEIDYQCCINCSSLSFVQLPSSLNYLGNFAFDNCTNLKTVIVLKDAPILSVDPFRGVSKISCSLFVPDESVSLYREAQYWGAFMNISGISEYSGIDNIIIDSRDSKSTYYDLLGRHSLNNGLLKKKTNIKNTYILF